MGMEEREILKMKNTKNSLIPSCWEYYISKDLLHHFLLNERFVWIFISCEKICYFYMQKGLFIQMLNLYFIYKKN